MGDAMRKAHYIAATLSGSDLSPHALKQWFRCLLGVGVSEKKCELYSNTKTPTCLRCEELVGRFAKGVRPGHPSYDRLPILRRGALGNEPHPCYVCEKRVTAFGECWGCRIDGRKR
jgi:hypothetical protein